MIKKAFIKEYIKRAVIREKELNDILYGSIEKAVIEFHNMNGAQYYETTIESYKYEGISYNFYIRMDESDISFWCVRWIETDDDFNHTTIFNYTLF